MLSSNFFATFFNSSSSSSKVEAASSAPATTDKNIGRSIMEMDKKYKSVVTIGSGGFGKVYSGFRRSDKHPVAIKVVSGKKVLAWKTMKGVQVPLEVAMHSKVQHLPGVVSLLDHYQAEDGNHVIVLERPDPVQDLFDFITQRGALDEFIARVFFRQIVETVVACHESGICHRDIKDENILVDMHTGRCYLIDFGSSEEMKPDSYEGYDAGTKVYCPPEWVKTGVFHTSAGTVWSLGILLYDMLTGDIPYETEDQILRNNICFQTMSPRISDRAKDLIRRCLATKPEQRPTLDQILAHPWLGQCKFDDNFAYYFKSYCARRTHRSKPQMTSQPIMVPSSHSLPSGSSGMSSSRSGGMSSSRNCYYGNNYSQVLSSASPSLSPSLWTYDASAASRLQSPLSASSTDATVPSSPSAAPSSGAPPPSSRASLKAKRGSLNSRGSSKLSVSNDSGTGGEMATC
ncbi:Serine/threonine-protein kinase pim-3 [Hypsibius exemplaris]|uniref:Serine/threonine-protein kinase 1 n=1 Tax=Hypsibius exemplaris TaxID=2072580 RepID=A0A1W0X9X1_HYPEX|nr:Serine/threonine-protein kinase pim-3 [Hypsibius exemplaris]